MPVVAFNARYILAYMPLPMSSPRIHLKTAVAQLSVRIIHIDSLKRTVGFRSRFTWDRESLRHVPDLISSDFVHLAPPLKFRAPLPQHACITHRGKAQSSIQLFVRGRDPEAFVRFLIRCLEIVVERTDPVERVQWWPQLGTNEGT